MNRTVEYRRFATSGIAPGVVVVAPFRHPDRGSVRFPTASAVAADLRRRGRRRVREQYAAMLCGPRQSSGWIFTASYLDRTGHAVGMAIGVHCDDDGGIATAQEVIESWRSTWRTRRVLVAPEGTCSANGSCPHVELTRAQLELFTQRGDHAVVIGGQGPDEAGTTSVGSVDEVVGLGLDPHHVAYLVQPGFVVEDAAPIISALRSRFPRIRGAHPDNICYGPSDRRLSLRILAATCDVVLVAGAGRRGGPPDPDAAALTGHSVIHEIADASELRPEWLGSAESIGVVAGAGSPADTSQQVVDALSGLGPLSVARRGVVTELTAGPTNRRSLHTGATPVTASETVLEFAASHSGPNWQLSAG